ncbi:hypothetical protein GCM10009853_015500 [Glycomyces scopariae]|uniref:Uncharacterized protein n=1 Tax=Glycomyces sambucus TaxID=380244 RepID=A0A1G9IA33_9ACTN|nr:hypothetical protein [Glycomyces sambucus]SDL21703.1 hypothetical protein SAMN05216298_3103 [Glycomyces sambucus]
MPQRPSLVGPVVAVVIGLAALIGGFIQVERTSWVFDGEVVEADDICSYYDLDGELLEQNRCSSVADLETRTEAMSGFLSFCGGVLLVVGIGLGVRAIRDPG